MAVSSRPRRGWRPDDPGPVMNYRSLRSRTLNRRGQSKNQGSVSQLPGPDSKQRAKKNSRRIRAMAPSLTELLDCAARQSKKALSRSPKGTFRMRSERWSESGARGRSRKPFPGGSGSPLDRHEDRSPRSSVDCDRPKRVTPARPGLRKRGTGAEPMLDTSGAASAATERREASAPEAFSDGNVWKCGARRAAAHSSGNA